MFKNWGKGVEPPEWATKEEVQEMIDDAIPVSYTHLTLPTILRV